MSTRKNRLGQISLVRVLSKSLGVIFLTVLLGLPASPVHAQVVNSTKNPNQIAILHWYGANQTTAFAVRKLAGGVAFDGANIWVSNHGSTTVTKLRASDGADQSIFSKRASQSNSTKWINCQIPASCQSRNRRQQVMPEPHPSSCGSIPQGMPLRNTNTMPARHVRSAKRGLPPVGFAFGVGMNRGAARR
jgi:hypothetical protein